MCLISYDLSCRECGEIFDVEVEDGSLGEIGAECPFCLTDDNHPIVQ